MGKYSGTLIHCQRDAEGPIEVIEAHGVRSLHFGTEPRQSAMALATPDRLELSYLRAMLVGLVFVPDPRRILVLGLGGGSLVRFLLQHYPQAHIDAVESRAALVEVARTYFGLPEQPALRVRIADAREYVHLLLKSGEPGYDLILVDVFDEAGLAPAVMQHDFFATLAELLTPGAALTVNLWSGEKASLREIMRYFKLYFPGGAFSLPVMGRGNVIAVGVQPERTRPRLVACRTRAHQLEVQLEIEFTRLLQRLTPLLRR